MRISTAAAAIALFALAGCQTTKSATDTLKTAGEKMASGATGIATSLVNVNLSNVLNDLALDLKIDKANIPINAQIPITVAANICGVSINILSVSTGGSPNCTATTTSPELAQAVQQQMAANGSVGGGAQTNGTPTTSTTQAPVTTTTTTDQPQDPQLPPK